MKTKFLLLIFCSVLLFCRTYAAETEPNDTRAQANTLALNGSNSGAIGTAGDVDWYKVTTTSDGQLNITFTSDGNNVTAVLYDNNGTIVLASGTTAGSTTISTDGLAVGTYYIQVSAYYNTQTLNYTITNNFVNAPVPIDAEPDSTRAQANVLALNGSTTGHVNYYYNNHRDSVDWYKVTTNADGLLRLTLTSLNGSNVSAYLFDNNGVTSLNSVTTAGTTSISTDGLSNGTYYIEIVSYYNNQFEPYSLADSLFTPALANNTEPDSTRGLAQVLGLNDSTTGHINYYYNNHRDSVDWYKVTTNADGLVRLTLKSGNGSNVTAYLFDNNGITLLNSGTTAGTTTISTDGLAAGTYFVEIVSYYNNQFEPYVLADSLFTPLQANNTEPDSTRALAHVLVLNDSIKGHINYYYNNHRDSSDWYKVTTNADGLLRLTLTSGNGSNISAYLFDNDGVSILNSGTTAGTTTISRDGLAAGTYYVEIVSYYNNQFEPYVLADSLFTYNPNDSITNTYALQAPTISANRTQTGHTNFYYNLQSDSTDWFKINYTGNGNMNLYFNLLPNINSGGISNVNFQVYRDTAAAPVFTNTTANAANTYSLSSLTQGYYYIRISPYYNNQFEAYSITDSFTQVNKAAISLLKATSPGNSCGSDSLTFKLSASHSPYTVRLFRDGSLIDSIVTTSDTARFTGLNDGSYYATVYGDGATDSAYSKTATSQFLPPAPSGLTSSNIDAHDATLNWSMLSCVQYYVVQYKVTGSSTYTTVNTPLNTDGTFTLTGLSPLTRYTWRIASLNPVNGLTSLYSDTAVFMTLSALPVTFINFDGLLQNNKALLSWSTATEFNNKGFEVQKSTDGHSFTGIGFINGMGNSALVNNYNFTDNKVLSGSNYYRLKQEDIDGYYNYSSIIRLDFYHFDWAIFGNPVTSNSWIQLQLDRNTNVAIQVISIDGKVVKTINKGNISKGTYSMPLNLGNVPSGTYIIKLVTNNQIFSKTVIK